MPDDIPPIILSTLQIVSENVDPDGSECNLCGDPCYLTQVHVMARIGDFSSVIVVLCGACSEMAQELAKE